MKARGTLAMLAMVCVQAATPAQQRDAATTQPTAAGNAVLTGTLSSGTDPGVPVARAIVTVAGGNVSRVTLTGDDGRYAVTGLPAGTYTIGARKAGWLPGQHGATRANGSGVPVVVGESARVEASFVMFKGAAVTGVLRDALGEPVSGVTVAAINALTGTAAPSLAPPELSVSDDRGVYRLFGLPPAEYVIVALPPAAPPSLSGGFSTGEIDSVLSALANPPGTAAAPLPMSRALHYSPTYHPGSPHLDQALRVKLGAGEERSNVDITVSPVLVGSIDGTVQVDGADRQTLRMDLVPSHRVVAAVAASLRLTGPDSTGRFTVNNLPPGRYRVIARTNPGGGERRELVTVPVPGGTQTIIRTSSPATPTGTYMYGYADVDVRGDERASVALHMQPGGVISGRVEISEGTAKPPDLRRVTFAVRAESAIGQSPRGGLIGESISEVQPDGTFQLRGIGPGRFRLTVTAPADDGARWYARSARLGDRELLDDWLDLAPGIVIPDVVVTLSDRRTGLDGLLQSASGQPTSAVNVVIVPLDRELWRAGPRRIIAARPQSDGRFSFDLPPGVYALAAVTDFEPSDLTDPLWLEQIALAGVKVTVAEGDRTRQDLRIR